jgi:hypothetical protein
MAMAGASPALTIMHVGGSRITKELWLWVVQSDWPFARNISLPELPDKIARSRRRVVNFESQNIATKWYRNLPALLSPFSDFIEKSFEIKPKSSDQSANGTHGRGPVSAVVHNLLFGNVLDLAS